MTGRLTVLVVALVACHPAAEEPCAAWADPDLSYTVEVMEATDTHMVPGGPYESCGEGRLFAQTGDALAMELREAGHGRGCFEFGPVFPLDGLDVVDGPHFGTGLGGADALLAFIIGDLDGCRIGLDLAIAPYLGAERTPASTTVLVRGAGAHSTTCVPTEFPTLESGCANTWFVKITDENGRVVTRHPDGGM